MARTARADVGGLCYHALTRGNNRERVFHDDRDYERFLDLMRRGCGRVPMDVLAFCLMPNHVHLVLRPRFDGGLGAWMQRVLTGHVRRHATRYGTVGRIWQGRFKSFPIQGDRHLFTVMRYVERNPRRADLVGSASDWPWSSLGARRRARPPAWLVFPPFDLGPDWARRVDEPLAAPELAAIRTCARRQRPYGEACWVRGTAERLGLLDSLDDPRG